jgi:hypothetical protein
VKTKIDHTCCLCERDIKNCWVTFLKGSKKPWGIYCSKECAKADMWGPITKDASIKKVSKL